MTATLVDTNVLLDLITDDSQWADWSIQRMDAAAAKGALTINDVIYAELSVRFAAIEAIDNFLERARIVIAPTPRAALFLAGKVFQRYRKSGGVRTGVLPDFFIGAHAAVTGMTLLSRDPGRYHTYFPRLELVSP
jgi:predicted nucleic acid-binding protein